MAWAAVQRLVRAMRSGGRRLDFLGLTEPCSATGRSCCLRQVACALNSLPAGDPAAEQEIIEMLQVPGPLSEQVPCQLMTAGERTEIKVLLCRADGLELRIRS